MNIAIVGLGTIGLGWVRLFRETPNAISLYDSDPAKRQRAMEVAFEGGAQRQIRTAQTLEDALAEADYVQESLPEDLPVKRAIFRDLLRHTGPDCVIASSASSLKISDITRGMDKAQRCLVVHPMNPPNIIRLVELVPGPETDASALDRAYSLMAELGRSAIICEQEITGFVANRLQCALEREAFELLREGVASAESIELAVKDGLGPRWAALGPFGVEATNGSSVAETLAKFQDYFEMMFASLGRPFSILTEEEIERVRAGLLDVYGTDDSDTLAAYRDSVISSCHLAVDRSASEHLTGMKVVK